MFMAVDYARGLEPFCRDLILRLNIEKTDKELTPYSDYDILTPSIFKMLVKKMTKKKKSYVFFFSFSSLKNSQERPTKSLIFHQFLLCFVGFETRKHKCQYSLHFLFRSFERVMDFYLILFYFKNV